MSARQRAAELVNQNDQKITDINNELDICIQQVWKHICKELNIKWNDEYKLLIDRNMMSNNVLFSYIDDGSAYSVCQWKLFQARLIDDGYKSFSPGPQYQPPSFIIKSAKKDAERLYVYFTAFDLMANHSDFVNQTMIDIGFVSLLHKRDYLFEKRRSLAHVHGMTHGKFL